jgi:hypothetical protein
MKFEAAHWRVPSEAHAFDGWLEGSPPPPNNARPSLLTWRARAKLGPLVKKLGDSFATWSH